MAHTHSLPVFQFQVDVMASVSAMPVVGPVTDAGILHMGGRNQKHSRWHLTTEKSNESPSLQSSIFVYPLNTEIWSCENNFVFKSKKLTEFR